VQGALKLILEPIFEADFQSGSFGYRPKKQLTKRSTEWPRRSFSRRHAS
jgi:retron-type reverse transcriptase